MVLHQVFNTMESSMMKFATQQPRGRNASNTMPDHESCKRQVWIRSPHQKSLSTINPYCAHCLEQDRIEPPNPSPHHQSIKKRTDRKRRRRLCISHHSNAEERFSGSSNSPSVLRIIVSQTLGSRGAEFRAERTIAVRTPVMKKRLARQRTTKRGLNPTKSIETRIFQVARI